MRSLKINWNQFIHPGLTPAQQIILLGDSPSSQVVDSGSPATFYRLTENGNRRITEAGDPRRTE